MVLLEWWNFMFLLPLASGLLIGVAIAVTGIGADVGDVGDADMGDADIGDIDVGE